MKMKKNKAGGKLVIIIAALCIIIYMTALVQSIIRFYLSVEQRKTASETEFANIADLASSAGVLGFMDEPFIETINEALMLSKSIEALIISGPDGEYAFERQKGRAISWVNNSPRFNNRFDFSGVSLYQPLRINGLRNVNIQAVANAFDYAAITKILKETLLLILLGFVLAFFTFLLQLLLDKPESGDSQEPDTHAYEKPAAAHANSTVVVNTPVYEKPAVAVASPAAMVNTPVYEKPAAVVSAPIYETPAVAVASPAAMVNTPVYEKPAAVVSVPIYETPAVAVASSAAAAGIADAGPVPILDGNYYETPRTYENKSLDEISEAVANAQIDDIDVDEIKIDDIEDISVEIEGYNLDEDDAVDLKPVNAGTDDTDTDDTEPVPGDDGINVPKGLYSQRSNIGWEEYTMNRLDSELHRCAATEEDLVLIVIEFTHGLSEDQFAAAAEEAAGFFTSRDLLFENGKYGITVIYPGVNLEAGILKSRNFQRKINEKLKLGNEISIGLSSRAGRLLNAGRILMEAMEALQKAKTDLSSSIIGFKSDPEKYRAFLGKQASGR
jgi:uncharacterized membrane protein